jgi:TMEM175 potassium channel family protein
MVIVRRPYFDPGEPMSAGTSEGLAGVARVEAFSDGVFAIAITLLILEIRVPADIPAGGLWAALTGLWSSYAAYALSFLIIGIMWANHHNIFRYIGRANHAFVMLNVALMFWVAFLPFPTAVLARYLPLAGDRTAATVLYGGTLTLTALCYNVLWRYAATRRRLLLPEADQHLVDGVTREYRFGPLFYLVATLVAFVSVWASLAIHAGLAGLYVLPTKSRP